MVCRIFVVACGIFVEIFRILIVAWGIFKLGHVRNFFNWGMQDILVVAYKIFFVETFVLSWTELKHSKQTLPCILTSGITQALHFASRDCNFLTYKDLQLGTPRFPTSRLFAWSCNFSYFSGLLGRTPLFPLSILPLRRTNTWSILPGVTEGALSTEMGVQARGHYAAQDWLFCSILHSVVRTCYHIHYTLASHSIEFAKNWVLSTSHLPNLRTKLNKNKNKNVRLFSLHVGAKTLSIRPYLQGPIALKIWYTGPCLLFPSDGSQEPSHLCLP